MKRREEAGNEKTKHCSKAEYKMSITCTICANVVLVVKHLHSPLHGYLKQNIP